MILTIDMGNSNIKIGVAESPDRVVEERVTTDYDKSSLEYATDIMSVLNFHELDKKEIEGAIISSVVPPLTGIMSTSVRKVLGTEPMIVSSSMKKHVRLSKFKYPKGVGPDLIVGAEAAFRDYGGPAIVINMGTATTLTIVDENAEFLGGVIMPGMNLSLQSLSNHAASLPEISLEKPGRVISRDTEQCMRSGIVYGTAGQIDALIDRMQAELGRECSLVATGGMARFAVPYCSHKIKRDDALMMKGLLYLYEQNR